MKLDDLALTPVPGDGVLCRLPGAVILALPAADQIEQADEVVALCRDVVTAAGGPPGRMLARRLAGLLSAADTDTAPAFCALGQAEAGIAVFVHGDVAVDIDLPAGPLTLSGRDAATWVDRIVDESFTAVTARHADGGPLEPDHRFDLRQGVTPANAFMLGRAGEAPPEEEDLTAVGAATVAPPPPPPPVEEAPVAPAAEGVEFEAVSLIGPAPEPEPDHAHDHVEAREPLPLAAEPAPEPAPVAESVGVEVDGIVCSRGHFNDPDGLFCSSCGISMVQQTHDLVKGPRPPLGFLVFDDGQTYQVDADYVIGRDPDGDEAVSSGRARPLVLDDPEGGISRRHAGIELEGWNVVFSDRGSTNGTYVWDAGPGQWRRLGTGERVTITPGTRLALGRRTMVFESPHER